MLVRINPLTGHLCGIVLQFVNIRRLEVLQVLQFVNIRRLEVLQVLQFVNSSPYKPTDQLFIRNSITVY